MGVVRGNTVCQKSSSSFYDESLDINQINLERGIYRNLNLPISSRNSSRRSSGYDNESNMNLMSPISLTSPYSLNNNNVISIKYTPKFGLVKKLFYKIFEVKQCIKISAKIVMWLFFFDSGLNFMLKVRV